AAGCAAKLSPKILDRVLQLLPRWPDENVLVGFDTADDAGVYRLSPDLALVQTLDFFTPIVDDPYTFGAIAAANALSDVYAMGGRPLTALSMLCYPANGDMADLEQMLRGGAEKIHEAGCPVIGGHSINEEDIKLGYSITGLIHPGRIKTNAGAIAGDVLLFTKEIGTGVIATALKRGIAAPAHVRAAERSMLTLNRAACEAMLEFTVHACTDVTGFSLLGHAREMALASSVTLEIDPGAVRLLPGALDYARAGAVPGGTRNNRDFVSSCVEGATEFDDLLYDPQTSGGLLIALPAADAAALEHKFTAAYRIGRVVPRSAKPVRIL
ncbi:MAG: selenide, water dikinase SelD, partial [Bryobacteraceae bacterium]